MLQAFQAVNQDIANGLDGLISKVDPARVALDELRGALDDVRPFLNTVKGMTNNEVFIAIVDGLNKFQRILTTRVRFTIKLPDFCLWVSRALLLEILHVAIACTTTAMHLSAWAARGSKRVIHRC
jgi:hypothetical protein